jgi:hypothetical protein
VARRRISRQSIGRAACAGLLIAALAAPAPAHAGFFDFLFGDAQDQPRSPQPQSYAEPPSRALGRVAPAALAPESVRQGYGSGGGRVVAYCVRLCDGAPFPLEHLANATPVETCRAMCPASATKVFYGSEIGGAVAKDGARYASLDTAFVFRQQLVANCTCNGRSARGLAPIDVSSDPTLRPGDIVSTKNGLMAYTGKSGAADAFTPVDPASIATELNSETAHIAAAPRRNGETLADAADGRKAQPAPPLNLGTVRGSTAK